MAIDSTKAPQSDEAIRARFLAEVDPQLEDLPPAFYERIGGRHLAELQDASDYIRAIDEVAQPLQNGFVIGYIWGAYLARFDGDVILWGMQTALSADDPMPRVARTITRHMSIGYFAPWECLGDFLDQSESEGDRDEITALLNGPFFDTGAHDLRSAHVLLQALQDAPTMFGRGMCAGTFFANEREDLPLSVPLVWPDARGQ